MKNIMCTVFFVMFLLNVQLLGESKVSLFDREPGIKWFQKVLSDYVPSPENTYAGGIIESNGNLDTDIHNVSQISGLFIKNIDDKILSWYWFTTKNRKARMFILSVMICSAYGEGINNSFRNNPWEYFDYLNNNEKIERKEELDFVLENRMELAKIIHEKIGKYLPGSDNRKKAMLYISKNKITWPN